MMPAIWLQFEWIQYRFIQDNRKSHDINKSLCGYFSLVGTLNGYSAHRYIIMQKLGSFDI